MEILVRCIATTLIIILATIPASEARVSSRAKKYPACYTDDSTWTIDEDHDCKHPLYENCHLHSNAHLCCGPDHYCCNNNVSCCRRNPWTVYEITGMVTGILSWICLLVVLCICMGPRWCRIAKKFYKRNRKISPTLS